MSGILSGMRVVEAAAFVAAPLGGMTLALKVVARSLMERALGVQGSAA